MNEIDKNYVANIYFFIKKLNFLMRKWPYLNFKVNGFTKKLTFKIYKINNYL